MTGAFLAVLLAAPAGAAGPAVVALDSRAPLVEIRVMVKGGSASDPPGREGLASLTAQGVIEGGFGDPADPVTKEGLAELTRPWGGAAYPQAWVNKEVTVFSFTVPREAVEEYARRVLGPMLARPLFSGKELDRHRSDALQTLRSSLRLQEIEELGLTAMDNWIHEGAPYAHPELGTEEGLRAIMRGDLEAFHAALYRPDNMVLGVGVQDPAVRGALERALAGAGRVAGPALAPRAAAPPAPAAGRKLLIVAMPNAGATGIHAGFPIEVKRGHPDYWPLYVANVWFGTHRDGFSHLYEVLREERGYNYGDYSYIEHFDGRPRRFVPPPNSPRRAQYFSIWVRPVAHEYAPHILKAITWELENFLRAGLSEEQCALSKNKAKTIYLSLAETAGLMLSSRLDDAWYGLEPGYLPSYLDQIDALACARINEALRRHLRTEDIRYLLVTDSKRAGALAEAVAADGPAWGKAPAEYQIEVREQDGAKVYSVPEGKLELLRRDAVWAHTPLGIKAEDIRVAPAERMFETAALPASAGVRP